MKPPLLQTREGPVAIISINDEPYNLMPRAFIDALEEAIEQIAEDDSVRAVVITAEGLDNFSAGMNLKQLAPILRDKDSANQLFDQRLRLILKIESLGKPVIATLFGFCLGGGLEISLGCHFRLAAEEGALIGLPEVELGLTPAWGGSARLARTVGSHHAINIILRGKKISGPEALRIGLVHEVWPLAELKWRAVQLAQELANFSSTSIKEMLGVLVNAEGKTLSELLAQERSAVMACLQTPDAKEGMAAFLEKRRPDFN